MTQQLAFDLSPRPVAYQAHSKTSKAASLKVAPKAGTMRWVLLEFLRGRGQTGATDEEMQSMVPMVANTQRPRRVELVKGLHIEDSGRTRKTCGGDDAVVWCAAEFCSGGGMPNA